MKRLILLVVFWGGLAGSLPAQAVITAQAAITRLAVVDMNRIIAAFTDPAAVKLFNEKKDRIQAEIVRLNEELQQLSAMLKEEEAREKKNNRLIGSLENEMSAKTQAVKSYIETMTAELEKDREQLQKRVNMIQINNAIRTVAEMDGYSMVFTRDGEGVLWYSPSVDITVKVLNRLSGNTRR
jgi:outer membrane protein